jgi:NADH-quinone oxidoreductase subunit G
MTDTLNTLAEINVNGKTYKTEKSKLLIEALEEIGIFIPRFCYHPRMKPVGMCRMCLVGVETPRGVTLQPACFIEVQDQMKVFTETDHVKKAQEGVLEFLLVNHPLDCPVCDKGGECPLQDQTLSYGPGESRFVEEKRHFAKPIPISKLIDLDRERCIQCARCTRFAEEIAGDPLIDFFARGDRIEVAIARQDFDNYFSGNIVQICPVGALTAKPYRFKARPWDLEQSESTCGFCSVGCRVSVQTSSNQMIRLLGIDSDEVNQSWLCDKGRFGYESADNARLHGARLRIEGELKEVPIMRAVEELAIKISETKISSGPDSIAFLVSPRLTNEEAYVYTRLIKGVIGTDNVDCRGHNLVDPQIYFGLPRAEIADLNDSDLVISLGCDLYEELPILYLRLRNAIIDHNAKVIEIAGSRTKLSKLAYKSILTRPSDVCEKLKSALDDLGDLQNKEDAKVTVILNGFGEGLAIEPEIANLLTSIFPNARYIIPDRHSNIFGCLDMGLVPGYLPARVELKAGSAFFKNNWGNVANKSGLNTKEILDAAINGRLKLLVLIGFDPTDDYLYKSVGQSALEKTESVYIGSHYKPAVEKCSIAIGTKMWGEKSGTFTNLENRVSLQASVVTGPEESLTDFEIAAALATYLGEDFNYEDIKEVNQEISANTLLYRGINLATLSKNPDGLIAPLQLTKVFLGKKKLDPIEIPGVASVETQGFIIEVPDVLKKAEAKEKTLPAYMKEYKKIEDRGEKLAEINGAMHYGLIKKRCYDKATMIKQTAYLSQLVNDKPRIIISKALADSLGITDKSQISLKNKRGKITGILDIDEASNVEHFVIDYQLGDPDIGEIIRDDGDLFFEVIK